MDKLLNIGYEDVDMFVASLTYGSVFVAYKTPQARVKMLENIIVTNEYMGVEILSEYAAKNENNEIIDGAYRIAHNERGEFIPELSEDDYNVRNYAKQAALNKSRINCKIDLRLVKMAKRVASANGVKFLVEGGQQYFSGEEKEMPLSKQVENAYLSGKDSISFEVGYVSVQTLRVYSSNLSITYNKKFRCAVNDGVATVYFKEPSRMMVLNQKADKLFMDLVDEFNTEKAIEMFQSIIDKYSNKPTHQEQPETTTISETNPSGAVRDVDDLQQYYIAELESEETETESDDVFYDPNDF